MRSSSRCFRSHRVTVLCTLSNISFFCFPVPINVFKIFFGLKRIPWALLLCNKKLGHNARLRRLERVFRCYIDCETMDDYRGRLMVWANYMSPLNSIVGYLWRHISYHGNAQGPQKRPLSFSFCKLSEKLITRLAWEKPTARRVAIFLIHIKAEI